MKKILFPTDFSETSDNAFVYAVELAKKFDAEMVLLHTFEFPIIDSQSMPLNYATIYDSIELTNFDHFKEKLPQLREIAKEHDFEHLKMSHILMDGDLIYSIKKVVKQEEIDFVIMGTNGASGWQELFIGTNTGSVISDVKIPVLSVPSEAKFEKIESIAFTTRFREKDSIALEKLLEIAKKLDAIVKCLYVKTNDSDVSEESIANWKSYFEKEPVQFFIIPHGDIQETIQDFLVNQSIDFLAMLTYKRNFFEEFFNSSLTQKLSYHLNTPILAYHE